MLRGDLEALLTSGSEDTSPGPKPRVSEPFLPPGLRVRCLRCPHPQGHLGALRATDGFPRVAAMTAKNACGVGSVSRAVAEMLLVSCGGSSEALHPTSFVLEAARGPGPSPPRPRQPAGVRPGLSRGASLTLRARQEFGGVAHKIAEKKQDPAFPEPWWGDRGGQDSPAPGHRGRGNGGRVQGPAGSQTRSGRGPDPTRLQPLLSVGVAASRVCTAHVGATGLPGLWNPGNGPVSNFYFYLI